MARVAVVDDIPANRDLLVTVLKHMGHEPCEAADGLEALALVERVRPALVICDLLMPVVDGYEFVRRLRENPLLAEIPVIFYTAHYLEAEAGKLGKVCGVVDVLIKPCEPERIIASVTRALSEASGDSAAGTATDGVSDAGDRRPTSLPQGFDRDHLRLVTDKLSQKVTELQAANRRLAVLSGINSAIVRIQDRRALFSEACRIAVTRGQFLAAWIGEVDQASRSVRLVSWAGAEETEEVEPLWAVRDRSAAFVMTAVRERRPVVLQDLSETGQVEEENRIEILAGGYRSLALPFVVEGNAAGVMVLYSSVPSLFDEQEMDLLRELGGDIAFALAYIGKHEMLAYLAGHDPLTGLPNRTLWQERLALMLQSSRQSGDRIAVVICNVNRFRRFNDTFGRQAGDALLVELGARFRSIWPDPTAVARIASDHFGGILGGVKEGTQVVRFLDDSVLKSMRRPVTAGGREFLPSISAGITIHPGDGEDPETLIKNAEAALRKTKVSGQHALFYRPEMNARVADAFLLETRLRRAVERDEFILHYQPKVDASSRRITGLEALLRWTDPEVGTFFPGRFMPLLEETGMIQQVGAWVIQRALEDADRWRSEGIDPPRIAVNVSPFQLHREDFVESTLRALDGCGKDECVLDLEITEGTILKDVERNGARLTALRERGVALAIDDFGTGYCSLGYLAKLPVDALKIDLSFVSTMTTQMESMSLISTIISLGHAMGLQVIAEGVESEDQARLLTLLKCDQLQGFLISPALPWEKVTALLRG